MYYYRARYYSHAIGRFLQTDPIGYGDGINWYAYCGNNPIGLVDPLGLYEEPKHRSFGQYGNTRFDYSSLDRDLPPQYGYLPWHFGNRDEIRQDLADAVTRGDATQFEWNMHSLQDTFAHGEGIWNAWDHFWKGPAVDNPNLNDDARARAARADLETRSWENLWDKYNPDYISLWDASQSLERVNQELDEWNRFMDTTQSLLDWYKQQRQGQKKGTNL